MSLVKNPVVPVYGAVGCWRTPDWAFRFHRNLSSTLLLLRQQGKNHIISAILRLRFTVGFADYEWRWLSVMLDDEHIAVGGCSPFGMAAPGGDAVDAADEAPLCISIMKADVGVGLWLPPCVEDVFWP